MTYPFLGGMGVLFIGFIRQPGRISVENKLNRSRRERLIDFDGRKFSGQVISLTADYYRIICLPLPALWQGYFDSHDLKDHLHDLYCRYND